MTWKMWGTPWDSGELSNTNLKQKIIFSENTIVKSIRTWVIVFNDPTFTNISMKIYAQDSNTGSPDDVGVLLHTSVNSFTKAEILTTEDNAAKELYFNFNTPTFVKDIDYFIVMSAR